MKLGKRSKADFYISLKIRRKWLLQSIDKTKLLLAFSEARRHKGLLARLKGPLIGSGLRLARRASREAPLILQGILHIEGQDSGIYGAEYKAELDCLEQHATLHKCSYVTTSAA